MPRVELGPLLTFSQRGLNEQACYSQVYRLNALFLTFDENRFKDPANEKMYCSTASIPVQRKQNESQSPPE